MPYVSERAEVNVAAMHLRAGDQIRLGPRATRIVSHTGMNYRGLTLIYTSAAPFRGSLPEGVQRARHYGSAYIAQPRVLIPTRIGPGHNL